MLIERLQGIKARYEELVTQLSQPETASDTALLTKLMREQAELAPLTALIDEYSEVLRLEDEAERMLDDRELGELARSELDELAPRKETLERDIQVMLLPKDPNDERNVIMEIRAGTGGEEAALFGQALYRMYSRYAERRGWKMEVLFQNETELGGMKEISFTIEGRGAYSRLKYESGAHRVQRVPETEAQGRIHTSAATVAVLPEAEEVDIAIEASDLRIDTFRAGGAGGQHVNRTDSAVRITHLPTGIVVQCQNERSQLQNREACMRMLRARLMDEAEQRRSSAMASDRKTQIGSGDRSERIRTYNFPQGRVTDHRTGQTLYQLDAYMDGDMDVVIDALIVKDQTERLTGMDN